eukprot:TRINITY_DN50362_c0_g1_i1.p1 TRINITY_DN50362_c0_g1~~TRINITY_DN50362_c0_g1_i1.p1  ORF type:complete len:512 (+),score=231.16 TRINITY_DN50362_c0_g1_i1:52-1587(+)
MESLREVAMDEVARHNQPGDMWMVIDGVVYDVSKFARMHPGGERVLRAVAGKDASEEFWSLHREEVLQRYKRLAVARVAGAKLRPEPPLFSEVPYAEMMVLQGFKSPYYTKSHLDLKRRVRELYNSGIARECAQLEQSGKPIPLSLYKKVAQTGVLAACLGPGPWLKGQNLLGVKGEDFDCFHETVFHQEFTRLGSQGFCDGLGGGLAIGLPPVVYFAKNDVKQRVVREVLSGDKRIALAISEPYVGSDVADIRCTATKSPCGKFYIVNGEKKWITGGMQADYFSTAVRTGGKGMGGISMLLIPRTEGVDTKQISTTYSPCAGTSYVQLVDVKVPVENLLGQENKGFMCIMANFNHERWTMIVTLAERCRIMVDECFKWANQRMVFGKKLITLPVIRAKLAEMVTLSEGLQHWLDAITFQMNSLSVVDAAKKLGGPLAMLKYHSTRVSLKIADHASQIFGGRSVTKSGMGQKVEQFLSNIKFSAILGGSEEVLADFGVRQAARAIPKDARL